MKLHFVFIICFFSSISFSQLPAVNTCLGTDKTICQGQPLTITDCNPSANIVGGLTLNSPTSIPLSDDIWSGLINIGFNFSFYGTSYSQCVIGSNGLISFNSSNANSYCPYSFTTGTTLPNSSLTSASNSIMLAYQDINPSGITDAIQYQTIGTAPNRKFIVLYQSVDGFSCGSTACTYSGVVLYETTNVIEIFIGNKGICSGWNNGLAYEGIQNSTGTNAVMVPGRNCSQWNVNQDGQRWTPTSSSNTNNYTNNQIPYIFINSALSNTTMWVNTLGQTFPYNNGVLNVNQTQAGPIGYYLSGTACSNAIGSISDTTYVTLEIPTITTSMTPDICNTSVGTVTATPTSGTAPYSFIWPTLANQTTSVINNIPVGTYTVTMTTSLGCSVNSNITVTSSSAIFTGNMTQVKCKNGSDGTVTATMTPVTGTLTYLWDDPLAQTTQTATGLSSGTYNCTITSSVGCNGNVSITVSEIPEIQNTISNFTNVSCNSGNDGSITISTSQGTAPYTYNWSNSASSSNFANDLSFGLQTIIIEDANGCLDTITQQINQPSPLSIASLTPSISDTLCIGESKTLSVVGSGGSSSYIYTWSENGITIGTGNSISVTPSNSLTTYCVTLSETCGSPTIDTCLTLIHPISIIPSFSSNVYEGCAPTKFEFTNTSNQPDDILTTIINFNDGNTSIVNGSDSISHTYVNAGNYSLDVIINSIYGCVYSKTITDFVLVSPIPKPDFFINPNPTTIFETKVKIEDRSSDDVTNWDWNSPFSNPTKSIDQSPTFKFEEGVVGQYPITLITTNITGCVDSLTLYLNVISDILFYTPNSFTPNGDEHNQSWKFYTAGIDKFDFNLSIYNRWGQIIFETNDPEYGWDGTYKGKIVEPGTYNWKVIMKDLYTDDRKMLYGSVNLLK